MSGPKEKRDRAPETEEEREPQNAPGSTTDTDIERDVPAQPEPDVERGREMTERRPHRDEP